MTDPAAPPQPIAAEAAPKSASPSEKRLIALLVAGPTALGALGQFFVPPGPLAAVVTAAGLSLVLIAAGQLVRGQLLKTLGGYRLAAVVLVALAVATALGTLLLQNRPESFYREQFARSAWLVLGLGLDDIFHSLWFSALLGLLVTGLVTSAIARWPVTLRNAGFFGVHLGIVVVLAGAGLSALFAVKGRIDLRVGGGPVGEVSLVRDGFLSGETLPLGGTVELLDFDVDRYETKWRMGLYAPSAANGWDLASSFEARTGRAQKLPGGASYSVEAVYPDYVLAEKAVPASEGTQGAPALQVTLDGRERWLVAGEQERLESADGKTLLLFGEQAPAMPPAAPTHTLQVGDGAPQPVEVGATLALADGTPVKVLRFLPHFTYDIEKKEARSLSDEPVNPALEIELGEGGPRRWLFARMQGHDHGQAAPVRYGFTPAARFETVLAASLADRTVRVRSGEKDETVPLTEGLELAGARFGKVEPRAKLERAPASLSDEMRNPAVLVMLTDGGEARRALLVASNEDAVRLSNGYVLTFEPAGKAVKTFRSHVRLSDAAGEREGRLVVNAPLALGAWQLYQADFRADDPDYSGLDAVRDPGVGWVFTGFGLLVLGVVYMIYVQPRLRRREG